MSELSNIPSWPPQFVVFLVVLLLGGLLLVWLLKILKQPDKQQQALVSLSKELAETRKEMAETRARIIELLDRK